MSKNTLYKIAGGAAIAVVIVGIYWWQRGDARLVQPASDGSGTSVEDLRLELERVTQYELEHGCVEKDERDQDVFCGESRARVDRAHASYQNAIREAQKPDEAQIARDKSAIRNFMGDQNLELTYMGTSHPANFGVGIVTEFSEGGGFVMDRAEGWERFVNRYQTAETIYDTCSVYEYEVYPKTSDVVQVHVVYPSSYEGRCEKTGSLFSPEVPEWEIKEVYAEHFLNSGGIPNYEFGLNNNTRIKNEFTITPRSKTGDEPDRYEWFWEDKSYKLPEGLSGTSAVDSRPTVRMFISAAGKLVQYNNTIPLFGN